jgi:hypothetical protein
MITMQWAVKLIDLNKYKRVAIMTVVVFLGFMVFNATFNNISVISWQSVLLVEETEENH